MTKPADSKKRLVPVVDPNYFALNCQYLQVNSTFVFWEGDGKLGACKVDLETGQIVLPDEGEHSKELAKHVYAVSLDNPQQRRLWLMQSILTMGRVTRHPVVEAALGALLDPEATDDYLAGIQFMLEQVYWEE